MRLFSLGLVVLFAACTKEKLPELYLLQGACEVSVTTDDQQSDIFVDGILIGHGKATTKVPCGEKKIQVNADGKWSVEDYKIAESRVALEVDYKLHDLREVKDWALSQEIIKQLKTGLGPFDTTHPNYKAELEARAKLREEEGYNYSPAELAAAQKKLFGSDEAGGDAGGAIKIDPNTNFDDPKTWM
jgi:hypothetical protein